MSEKKIILSAILNLLNGMPLDTTHLRLSEARTAKIKRIRVLIPIMKNARRGIPKNIKFLQIIDKYPDDVFKSHFRMTRPTFQIIKNILNPYWTRLCLGRPKIHVKLALYLTLWKIVNNCSFRQISNLFNVAKGAAFKYFIKVTKILFVLRGNYIKWPETTREQRKIMDGFASLRNNPFPNVLGCLDGTHIPIIAPTVDKISYFNRKGTYSINMQAICDHNQKFIDICFGFPGSVHDACVWEHSSIEKALKGGSTSIIDNGNILGDSAYPLSSYLMVPYRDNGHLNTEQRTFNYIHSSNRVCVEQAFGRLKSMFRILKGIDIKNLSYAKYIVIACVVVHNIIIEQEKENSTNTEGASAMQNDDEEPQSNNLHDLDYVLSIYVPDEARAKRDNIAMLFSS